jgi:hypothetical protein
MKKIRRGEVESNETTHVIDSHKRKNYKNNNHKEDPAARPSYRIYNPCYISRPS